MSKSKKPTFSPSEAKALVDTVRSAPLQNMMHAESVGVLLQRFTAWYNALNAKTVTAVPKPKE